LIILQPTAVRTLVLLWITYFLNYVDRQVVFSFLPALQRDLLFTDWQLGLIGSLFIWSYSLSAPAGGWMADRMARIAVVCSSLALWSACTLGTGLAGSVNAFLAWRVLMGVTEALYFPAALSLIASAVPGDWRSKAIALHGSAQFAGIAAGGWFGGWMAELHGWRTSFYVLAAAGFAWAPVLTTGLRSWAPGGTRVRQETTIRRLGARCYRSLLAAFFAICAVLWMIYAWLPTMFQERLGLTPSSAGFNATLFLQAGAIVGILAGGFLGDRAARSHALGRFGVIAASLLACAPFAYWLMNGTTIGGARAAAVAFGLTSGVMLANNVAAAYDVVPEASRGAAAGILTLVGGVAGGLGILFAGGLKSTLGIAFVFNIGVAACVVTAAILYLTARRRFAAERLAGVALAAALSVTAQQPDAGELRKRYVEMTSQWARDAVFSAGEAAAMENGRKHEKELLEGLDDPLGRRILDEGEPSLEALWSVYPPKILDRTVLGTFTDPAGPMPAHPDEFTYWWNGAISAHLVRGHINAPNQVAAFNTNFVFRVGRQAEMFGRDGARYSRIAYEEGYLPVLTATYAHDGISYRQTAFAARPDGESEGWDIAFVRFEMRNLDGAPREARLHADVILVDQSAVQVEDGHVRTASGPILATDAAAGAVRSHSGGRLTWRALLGPGGSASVYLKAPLVPDAKRLLRVPSPGEFERALEETRRFWRAMMARCARISTPEQRINDVWRALLVQTLVLADGPRLTYGAGLMYNDSYFPHENGFGTNTLARFGLGAYSVAYLPWAFEVSVQPSAAGRKYQNRRAMPMHHLFENWRLTGSTAAYGKYRAALDRIAGEIIAERRSTMRLVNGARPLHWGLLPPDKPGVDLRASTQTVYVLAHNITNCQGLQDYGEFLVRTGLDAERGRRYREEAAAFRADLMEAMRRAAIRTPGRPPFVDLQTLYFRETPEFGPEPYDHLALGRVQGTYFGYWVQMQFQHQFFTPSGDPNDPGGWLADYVEQRGGLVLGNTRARRRPGDPEYGWINNVYNEGLFDFRLRGGDVSRFLLGFYARLAFGMSRHVLTASEGSPFVYYNTRYGGFQNAADSYPNSAANTETLNMLRTMLIHEELRENIETGVLHLARGAPRRWFGSGRRIEVLGMPTYFGPASYTIEPLDRTGRIHAQVRAPAGRGLRSVHLWLRHPRKAALRAVSVNGARHADFEAGGLVRLRPGAEEQSIEARFSEP